MDATARHLAADIDPGPRQLARPPIAPVARLGAMLVASGQTAVRDGELIASGRIDGGRLDEGRRCARQCARNVVAAVIDDLGTLSPIRRVARVNVYVSSAEGFTDQHLVADSASEYFLEVFGPDVGRHARAAIGVAGLPTGSPVEVDAVFELEE